MEALIKLLEIKLSNSAYFAAMKAIVPDLAIISAFWLFMRECAANLAKLPIGVGENFFYTVAGFVIIAKFVVEVLRRKRRK